MSVGGGDKFSHEGQIIWITGFTIGATILLIVSVILLQQKRKKWLANDEWLEKNKQEIMNEVLVHERFLQVYEQMENEEVNEAQIRSMSGFFSD
jgi:peptidyl-tRNA hydrolase